MEDKRFLSAVRKEKDAFTRLIREKGNMALVIQSDIAVEDPQEFFLRTINTRIAGGGRVAATAEPPRVLSLNSLSLMQVIVDSREFRSSLPSLLHGRNLEVVPAMLTVGDYVLSPEMVVERKSIKDLIQSLNSGRLYNQCETMMQYYRTPLLLIEFDQNKSFNLEVSPCNVSLTVAICGYDGNDQSDRSSVKIGSPDAIIPSSQNHLVIIPVFHCRSIRGIEKESRGTRPVHCCQSRS